MHPAQIGRARRFQRSCQLDIPEDEAQRRRALLGAGLLSLGIAITQEVWGSTRGDKTGGLVS
jgi:hypothetical protein